ncbi:GLPGLI family protein [Soonwooa sp.]|uniref:GLPGLI family protein n=1 Tax=Soonwooa sp. TaxID=1938592 RepID=UPI0028B06DF7|nr:GLPGLI family protein [Soonwooa sp.]
MKYILGIIGVIVSQFASSQATRFVYQASMTPDSTKLTEKKIEKVYLDVEGQKSVFYSENRAKRDSIMARMRQTKNFDRSQIQDLRSIIDYSVEKDLAKQNLNFKQRIARDQYIYEEQIPNTWKVLPETVKIGNYQTQKAEQNYGGRTWYAWFTTDVPLQDGPYKFGGLPGLIVKLEDSKGDYSFDLMESKKIASIQSPESRGQDISIKKEKFLAIQKKFQQDPISFMNINSNRMGDGQRANAGNPQRQAPSPQQMQDMQKRMLDDIKSRNNPIEKL